MKDYKRGSHTVWDCKYHLVWTTKYRYQVLEGDIGLRCRELLREIAMSKEMIIYAGSINRDHVHSVSRSGGIQEGEATCCM
jgi:putative transposase